MSIQNKQNGINLIFKVLQQSHSFITKNVFAQFLTMPQLTAKARQQYIFYFFDFFFFKVTVRNATQKYNLHTLIKVTKRCCTSGAEHGGHTPLDCIKPHCTLFYSVVSKVKKIYLQNILHLNLEIIWVL